MIVLQIEAYSDSKGRRQAISKRNWLNVIYKIEMYNIVTLIINNNKGSQESNADSAATSWYYLILYTCHRKLYLLWHVQ